MYNSNDPMKAYMQEIGVIPLITKEEEVEFARRIKLGDNVAKQKLIKANLRLVVKIAHDFKGLGLPLLDLISEGNIGLMRAAEKFDPLKGAKFSSYSAWWIKQAMRRALSQKSRTIRVPVASASKINRIRAAKIQLSEKYGRMPTDVEIANHLDLSKRTVQGLKLADLKTFSIHDPIQKGEDGNFEDIIPDVSSLSPDDIIEGSEIFHRLKGLIHKLDEREQIILVMRYGLSGNRPKTLEEVSYIIGRTRERVRQIQMQSLKKLKAMIDDENIDNYGNVRKNSHLSKLKVSDTNQSNSENRINGNKFRINNKSNKNSLSSIPIIEVYCLKDNTNLQNHDEIIISCQVPLSTLNISRRSVNGLHSIEIKTVAELATKSAEELMNIRYFGNKCLNEVQDAFKQYINSV